MAQTLALLCYYLCREKIRTLTWKKWHGFLLTAMRWDAIHASQPLSLRIGLWYYGVRHSSIPCTSADRRCCALLLCVMSTFGVAVWVICASLDQKNHHQYRASRVSDWRHESLDALSADTAVNKTKAQPKINLQSHALTPAFFGACLCLSCWRAPTESAECCQHSGSSKSILVCVVFLVSTFVDHGVSSFLFSFLQITTISRIFAPPAFITFS